VDVFEEVLKLMLFFYIGCSDYENKFDNNDFIEKIIKCRIPYNMNKYY
jgi:hypothetical protein